MIKVQARGERKAEVLIHEPIGADFFGDGLTSKRFIKDLEALGDVDHILVRINSPGGAVWDGIAIHNALKAHKARVDVLVEGLAASIASVIAMAGKKIEMSPGAMMMVHNPWTVALGDANDMREVAETLDQVAASMSDVYVLRTGQARKDVRSMMDDETWMSGEQAVAKGFADSAAEATEEVAASATATYKADFKKFSATCREQLAAMSPLQLVAAIRSATADATIEVDTVEPKAPASAAPPSNPPAPAATPEQIAATALARDGERRTSIRTAFGRYTEQHRALLDACLEDTACTVDRAREQLLAKLGETAAPLAGPVVLPGADARQKFIAGAEIALGIRMGLAKRDQANEFSGMSLPDLAAHALGMVGISVKGLTKDGIARRVFATHSTSDFPQLMSNVAGKVLQAAYGNFPNTYNLWCAIGQVSDFKVHPRIQIGSFNNLATIAEGGEYTYGSTQEEYENAQAVTKGKAIALTRQMIVNDDLGAFNRRAQMMGRAAARTVNTDAYAYLTSGSSNHGPTSTDTGQFFNATAVTTAGGHANLTSSGTAISVASLGVGRVAMRKQKDKTLNETLNIEPTVLLVPVGKEDLARQVVTSETDPASSNSRVPNIHRNRFTVVSDPYLDGISATAWYEFANPSDVAAFEVVFLDGNQTPFVDEAIDWDTDAMKFKVRLDYGVASGDWRGGYKNAGA